MRKKKGISFFQHAFIFLVDAIMRAARVFSSRNKLICRYVEFNYNKSFKPKQHFLCMINMLHYSLLIN